MFNSKRIQKGKKLLTYEEWFEKNKNSLKCKPRSQQFSFADFIENGYEGISPINFKKGEIYYAKITKKSKKRPFVIWQNNFLNEACFRGDYHSVIVLPLSSKLIGGEMRYKIESRENLPKTSEIVCNAIGIVAVNKFLWDRGLVAKLTQKEIEEVKKIIDFIL
jgi:mRNA interferase MazF